MVKNVAHLIVGLGKGGAETMLYQVVKYRNTSDFRYKVISLGASHYFEEPIRELGVPVVEISFKKHPFSSMLQIYREIKGYDTLCCWMYHANIIGFFVGKIAGISRIVWGIHHSDLSTELNKKSTMWLNKLCALVSKWVDVISYTGEIARKVHEANGYASKNGIVLSNGCNCEEFHPDDFAKKELCRELKIESETKIILSVSKDIPIKDNPNFIKAFSIIHSDNPETVAVMCGRRIDEDNNTLAELCSANKLMVGRDIFLLGMRNDVARLLAGCDLYVLHSAGEAFPVTLVEAMACGCLCVATDVGDVKIILDDNAFMCESKNYHMLATKFTYALQLSTVEKSKVKMNNRTRACNEFNILSSVKSYEEIF